MHDVVNVPAASTFIYFTMTTREDGAQSPPTGIASTEDDGERAKSTGGATNGAEVLQDGLSKRQYWGFTPAKDSRFVDYGLIPPYSPFPPPGYYLQHLSPMQVDPNSASTAQNKNQPPPYSPFCMPFPPSPYYSDPNGARARCTPSPKSWPTSSWPTSSSVPASRSLPRPLRAEATSPHPRKIHEMCIGTEKVQGVSRKSRLVDPNLVNSNLAPPAKEGVSPEQEEEDLCDDSNTVATEETDAGTDNGRVLACQVYVKATVPLSKYHAGKRTTKNGKAKSRSQSKREWMKEIEAKPEHERTMEEKVRYLQLLDQRERKNARSRERARETKAEIERILDKPVNKRTKAEVRFLQVKLKAKLNKNKGDQLRRLKKKVETAVIPPIEPEKIDSYYEQKYKELVNMSGKA